MAIVMEMFFMLFYIIKVKRQSGVSGLPWTKEHLPNS